MNKIVSLAFLAAGIVVALFGLSEMNSFTSDISRMFTGAPTDRSIWMLAGGAALLVLGVTGLATGSRRH
ncbi:MAG TPA: hypothetical protein DEQ40_07925 [Oxalobacteraceae bacterium]|jgi:hypothetical protein|nr:hypothetical protein [Oxalobacteraceae bacterium]